MVGMLLSIINYQREGIKMNQCERVLKIVQAQGIDGMYITKKSNVNYLTGYPDELAYAVIGPKGQYVITDSRFTELAEQSCPGFEIVNWHLFDRSIPKAVADTCKKAGIKRLGFEECFTTFDKYTQMNNLLVEAGIEMVPTQNVIEELRYTKSEEEVKNTRIACKIADQALEELIPYIKPGVSERELCARLEFSMKMHGAHDLGFETILISGAKTSLLHGKPSDKKVEEGDFVLVDFGAMYNGYISDMTRTFIVGEPDEKQVEIYNLVKEAQEIGLSYMGPGVHATKPDAEIRKHVAKYEEYYYAGIGHGVGLDLHEEPFIGNYGTKTMETGCVITMEPGIYIPGWGGVRIEDTVLITEDGIERLTHFPKELMILK